MTTSKPSLTSSKADVVPAGPARMMITSCRVFMGLQCRQIGDAIDLDQQFGAAEVRMKRLQPPQSAKRGADCRLDVARVALVGIVDAQLAKRGEKARHPRSACGPLSRRGGGQRGEIHEALAQLAGKVVNVNRILAADARGPADQQEPARAG